MRFRLLIGSYSDIDERNYQAGDVVETETDLIARFGPEKFMRLSDNPAEDREFKRKASVPSRVDHIAGFTGRDD